MRPRSSHILLLAGCLVAVLLVVAWFRSHGGAVPPEDGPTEAASAPGVRARDTAEHQATARSLPDGSTGTPEIELNLPGDHLDFGVVSNTSKTTYDLPLRNTGNGDLVIERIRTTCGCTTGAVQNQTIPPGGETTLTVTVDPNRMVFDKTDTVTIVSNDPENPNVRFKVSCEVDPEFSVEPAFLNFGQVEKGDTPERTILVRQLTERPFEVTGVETLQQPFGMDFDVRRRPESAWQTPGRAEYEIAVRVREDAPVGRVGGRLTILHNINRLRNRYRYAAQAQVSAFYRLDRPRVAFRPIAAGEEAEGVQHVIASEPLTVRDVTTDVPGLEAVAEPANDDHSKWSFRLAAGPDIQPGRKSGMIRFTVEADGKQYNEAFSVNGVVLNRPMANTPPPS